MALSHQGDDEAALNVPVNRHLVEAGFEDQDHNQAGVQVATESEAIEKAEVQGVTEMNERAKVRVAIEVQDATEMKGKAKARVVVAIEAQGATNMKGKAKAPVVVAIKARDATEKKEKAKVRVVVGDLKWKGRVQVVVGDPPAKLLHLSFLFL